MKTYKEIKEDGWIYITAPFPEDLAMEARIQAASENISRSELMRRAVEQYLQRRPSNQRFHADRAGGPVHSSTEVRQPARQVNPDR